MVEFSTFLRHGTYTAFERLSEISPENGKQEEGLAVLIMYSFVNNGLLAREEYVEAIPHRAVNGSPIFLHTLGVSD